MTLERKLKRLFEIVRDEARRNPDFKQLLVSIFSEETLVATRKGASSGPIDSAPRGARRGNRRAASVVDPSKEIKRGEGHLRILLAPLTLEQLRDVVADCRMDPSKLVMKWHDRERVIDHIITTSISREKKGDAFRS